MVLHLSNTPAPHDSQTSVRLPQTKILDRALDFKLAHCVPIAEAPSWESAVREDTSKNTDSFVRDLTAHQRRIYAYIRSLVWNAADANDVLQNANEVLWVKRSEFTPGSDFGAWAIRVAHFEVLAYRKRALGDRHVYSEELLAKMADSATETAESVSDRGEYLKECLDELEESDRALLCERYQPGAKVADIARREGRSAAAVSQLLFRIRNRVMDCIKTIMAGEGDS